MRNVFVKILQNVIKYIFDLNNFDINNVENYIINFNNNENNYIRYSLFEYIVRNRYH